MLEARYQMAQWDADKRITIHWFVLAGKDDRTGILFDDSQYGVAMDLENQVIVIDAKDEVVDYNDNIVGAVQRACRVDERFGRNPN